MDRTWTVGLLVYSQTYSNVCSNRGYLVKREQMIRLEAMTIRELGDLAFERGVSAASLLPESEPRPAPAAREG